MFVPGREVCPACGCKGDCRVHSYYDCNIVDFVKGKQVASRIRVTRVICSCGHTHAILPDAQSREWLDECFLNRLYCKVRKDATVSIDKASYDAPMQFIDQTVEIRFRPGEMDSAFILYEGSRFPLRLTDRNENCRTRRQNGSAIDYSKLGGRHV